MAKSTIALTNSQVEHGIDAIVNAANDPFCLATKPPWMQVKALPLLGTLPLSVASALNGGVL